VVEEYQRGKKKIRKLEEEVKKYSEKLENHTTRMEEAKTGWLTPLRELIGEINKNFAYYFKCMKCAGEVDLDVPENPVRKAECYCNMYSKATPYTI